MSFYHPFINGSQLVSNGLISTFNSNTLGNLFTTGGNVGIGKSAPTSALDVSGTVKADTINVTGITASNINFTGSLYQNGVAYSSSQWTTTSGNVSYTSGSVITGAVSASNMISINSSIGTINATGITASNINFTGSLYQNGVAYSSSQWTTTSGNVSYTSGSVVSGTVSANNIITSDATIGTLTISNFAPTTVNTTSLTTANFIVGNMTTGTLVTNNVNVGVGSMFGGSFNAANNVSSASNVTGFSFNSSNVASFTANVSVVINATANLYESFTLNGAYSSTGWVMTSTGRGDVSGVAFTITSGGQVQYTSTNVSGWTSSTFRFTINQNSINGNYSSLSAPTSGNTYIFDSISLTNTADALSLSSTGSMNIAGGLTVQKSLYAQSISTSNFMITNLTTTNFAVTNSSVGTLNVTGITATNINSTNSSIGTLNATGITAGNITTTGITTTNIISTNSSVGTLNATGITAGNITATRITTTNIISTNSSVGSINATGITTGNLNFTGSLYQNGSLYSPGGGATWNGFNVTASTSGNAWATTFSGFTCTSDGLKWQMTNNESLNCTGVVYANGTWYASNITNSPFYRPLYTTTDLVNWSGNTSASTLLQQGNCIAYGNNIWVMGGNKISSNNNVIYSTDGNTWANSNSTLSGQCYTVVFNGSMFVAGGYGTNTMAYSTNGSTWTAITSNVATSYCYGIVYGNSTWVAVGDGTNRISYSSNGTSWTGIANPFGSNAPGYGVAFGNGTFVAYSDGGTYKILYSTNGSSWTGVTLSNDFAPFSISGSGKIVFNGTYFIITSSGNYGYLYSSDGINWNVATPIIGNTICTTGQTSSSLIISNQNISFSTGTAQTSYYNTSGTFVAPKSAYYNISMSAYGIGGISGSSLILGGYNARGCGGAINTASQFIYLSSGSTLQPYISVGKFQSWQVMYT